MLGLWGKLSSWGSCAVASVVAVGRQAIPATDRVLLGGQAADSGPTCSKVRLLCWWWWRCWGALLLEWRAGVGSVEPCPVSLAPGSLHLQLSFSSVQMG